ncbi:MAG: apolipoprotein N-acyltransferase [Candidatus Pelagibacter sp.]
MTKNYSNNFTFFFVPFICGLLSTLSLPPYNYFYLNFISFPILLFFYINLEIKKRLSSFIYGWIFGFSYFFSNIYWIANSLTVEEVFKPLIPFAITIIPLFLGLFYGITFLIFFYFNPKKKIENIFLFALIFSFIEYLRGHVLGGFPWNLISFSLVEINQFIQILSFVGTYSFNLIVVTIFLVPAVIFFEVTTKEKMFTVLLAITLILSNFIYGILVLSKHNNIPSKQMNPIVKIISPKIDLKRFFDGTDPALVIKDLAELGNIDNRDAVYIYPEGILPSINLNEIQDYSSVFKNYFQDNHKIIVGITRYKETEILNSMALLDNNLKLISVYDKNKLVPFGEYLPFENFFRNYGLKKITQGYQSFSSAKKRSIISLNDLRFLPLICYEIIYSGSLFKNSENYDFIINISEDGWFGKSVGIEQHFFHSVFRSIEEGKNIIRSANNGISAYIDSKGQIIKKIESTQKGVIEIDSYKNGSKTIFSSLGNKIFFYFLIFYITIIFLLKIRERQ